MEDEKEIVRQVNESEVCGMNTVKRVKELCNEREISLFKLSEICDISYSTLKNTERRNGQLMVDTIERICLGLGITMAEFFTERGTKS